MQYPDESGAPPIDPTRDPTRSLLNRSAQVTVIYLFMMLVLWLLGVESIYGHPTPFYALYAPVFTSLGVPLGVVGMAGLVMLLARRWYGVGGPGAKALGMYAGCLLGVVAGFGGVAWRASGGKWEAVAGYAAQFGWHLPVLLVACGAGLLLLGRLRRCGAEGWNPGPREERRFLLGVFVFLVLFSISVAMVREGLTGVSQAYARETYEYVGDIGKTSGIRALFTRYTEIHEYLSMHAKVHPPGPIALLWVFSWFVGRGALALSLATIVGGCVAVFPLYAWAKQLLGAETARVAVLLYAVVPSVVLFTATSTDILFTPFTLTTLWLFDRALARGRARDAVAAGLLFGVLSILKFSLLALGAYFAFAGLLRLSRRREQETGGRPLRVVTQTAVVMLGCFLTFHALLYLWSGFDMIETFRLAKQQFDTDQHHLDQVTPRLAAWTYRIWNPLTWFFFAGIPVSLLFLWRLWRPVREVRGLLVVFLLTVLVLNLLYLARGEGERSALYLFPFLVLPAAHLLEGMCRAAQSWRPLLATLGFMALQCWAVEAYFYTYW